MTVVAGANGAGKSTYSTYLRKRGERIIDPDALARDQALSAIGAGRAALMIAREHLAVGQSFGIETTLAGEGALRLMRLARAESYEIDFAYLGTDNVEINLQRIAARVADGGHDIDEIDVRRRYTRSLAHLPTALALADRYVLLDNTERLGFDVFAEKDDLGIRLQGTVPNWARGLDLP